MLYCYSNLFQFLGLVYHFLLLLISGGLCAMLAFDEEERKQKGQVQVPNFSNMKLPVLEG